MDDEFTIGAEEEYQLVDAETGALCSRARDVLVTDWTAEIRPELQETTLEIGSRVCASAAELDRELRRLRFQVATTAASLGLEIAAAGVHPFSRWEEQRLADEARYRAIAERYGRVARDEHNFGMHVHVGVPRRHDRIRLQNVVRHYVPHLIALSASSPFYEGEDTGYASFRMVLWRRWPNAGVPPRLESEREYRELLELLLSTGAIGDRRNHYWSVRPHAVYPTLEVRVTDVCPRVDDAVGLAALVRALVVAAAEGRLREPGPDVPDGTQNTILAVNEWRAMRFGLDGWLVDPAAPDGRRPMRSAVHRLVDDVAPIAEALGDAAMPAAVAALLERGNGADRMRRIHAATGGLKPVVDWVIGETLLGTGLDRRRMQRGLVA
ncbi:MAG TPA: YbdK family carboxylate-amine ligase [Longimicrobiales bacterium]